MPDLKPEFRELLARLCKHDVRFVLIGGVAMSLQGSDRGTLDIDVIYCREASNLAALVEALADIHPRLRTVSGDVPFLWDVRTLKYGQNFTLRTNLGDIDLLADVTGAPEFESLLAESDQMDVDGLLISVATLDQLIAMKRTTGRTKDQLHLLELEALRKLINEQDSEYPTT